MNTAICTLFERDYHYGVGVLVNSLYNHGFRGVVWAGYKGNLPPWALSAKENQGYHEYSVATDCVIRFVKLTTRKFLNNYKADFMLELWESYSPEAEAIFYFDPDIVNKNSWDFYQTWVNYGIALCEDAYDYMPTNHPFRLTWKELAESHGYVCRRELDRYYNAGFIGVRKNQKSLLELWKQIMETFEAANHINLGDFNLAHGRYPYFQSDQCVLNLTLMLSDEPLSTVSKMGMDFGGTVDIMSHASGAQTKPWRKKLISQSLGGVPPTLADRAYWKNTQAPIQVYSRLHDLRKKIALRFAAAIGRFIRRYAA